MSIYLNIVEHDLIDGRSMGWTWADTHQRRVGASASWCMSVHCGSIDPIECEYIPVYSHIPRLIEFLLPKNRVDNKVGVCVCVYTRPIKGMLTCICQHRSIDASCVLVGACQVSTLYPSLLGQRWCPFPVFVLLFGDCIHLFQ